MRRLRRTCCWWHMASQACGGTYAWAVRPVHGSAARAEQGCSLMPIWPICSSPLEECLVASSACSYPRNTWPHLRLHTQAEFCGLPGMGGLTSAAAWTSVETEKVLSRFHRSVKRGLVIWLATLLGSTSHNCCHPPLSSANISGTKNAARSWRLWKELSPLLQLRLKPEIGSEKRSW